MPTGFTDTATRSARRVLPGLLGTIAENITAATPIQVIMGKLGNAGGGGLPAVEVEGQGGDDAGDRDDVEAAQQGEVVAPQVHRRGGKRTAGGRSAGGRA
jgi:hypothetical protein